VLFRSRSLLDIDVETRMLGNLILLLTVTAFLFLRWLSLRLLRDVLDPLERIRLAVRPETFRGYRSSGARLASQMPVLAPRELIELSHNLDGLRDELQRNFGALQHALHDREEANAKLAAASVGLEETVAHRTRELIHAVEEAQAAARAKAEFLATMSHELRTPLNAVIGSIDALREGVHGALQPAQLQALDEMEHGAQHLLAMIGDILDMERLASGRLEVRRERVDLRHLLDVVRGTVAPLCERAQLTWRAEVPAGALWLDGDALRLQQVLLNLCGNAIKFSPPGGEVRIRVLTGIVPGRVDRIEVIDRGIGIPVSKLEEIFAPFGQASHGDTRRYEGSGLGLTIARGLCEAMGLTLSVASTEGEGAVFTIAVK
jgi:signal transduction histidine kinase